MHFLFIILSFVTGLIAYHFFAAKVESAAIKDIKAGQDFAYSHFNAARVEYKKLKAGLKHDLDRVLSVF